MARAKKSPTRTAQATDSNIINPVHGCLRFNSACIASLIINMEAGTISGRILDDLAGKAYQITGTITEEE